jgi:hypothetical protein
VKQKKGKEEKEADQHRPDQLLLGVARQRRAGAAQANPQEEDPEQKLQAGEHQRRQPAGQLLQEPDGQRAK